MMGLVADHLWHSTLWAAVIALAARALARQPAQVRYLLWLTASIKFLVPFAALVWIGRQLGARPLAPPVAADATFTFEIFTHPFTASRAAMPLSPVPAIDISQLLIAVWIGGAMAVLAAWFVRWRRIHRVVQAGAPVH